MTTRNLGGIVAADLQTNDQVIVHFVKFVIPVVGTKRFVIDTPGPITATIDGGSQTWVDGDILLGALDQNEQRMLSVSSLSIANLDYTWTNWANTAGTNSLRGTVVTIYRAQYNPVTNAILGSYIVYQGRLDNGDYDARAQIALVPYTITWGRTWPWAICGPICPYVYKDGDTCQSTSTDTTCDRTRLACQTRTGGSNETRFGGDDLMPLINVVIPWGNATKRGT